MTGTDRKVSNSTQSTTSQLSTRFSLSSTLRSSFPSTWSRSRSDAKHRRAAKAALALRELILDPTTPPTPSTEPHTFSLAFLPPDRPDKAENKDPTDYFRTWTPKRGPGKSTVPRLRPKDVERLRTQLLVPSQASLVIASARTLEPPLSNPNARIGQGAEPMRAVCLDCMEDKAESMIRKAKKVQAGRKDLEAKLGKDKWGTVKAAPVAPARLPVLLSLLGPGRKRVSREAKVAETSQGIPMEMAQTAVHSPELDMVMDENPLESPNVSPKKEVDKLPRSPMPSTNREGNQMTNGESDLDVQRAHQTPCDHCAYLLNTPLDPEPDPFPIVGDSLLPFGLFLPASAMSLHRPLAGALPTPETLRIGFDALINAESKIYLYEGPSHVGISPPLDRMSIYTYWWGFELALPPPSLEYLSNCKQMTASLLNLLGVIVYAVPGGTRELAPFVGVLSRFIESEWRTLKAQDRGKGVVCGATWFIPAALVARPWDFDDPLEMEDRKDRAKKAADAAMGRSIKA